MIRPEAIAGGATRAFLDGQFTINASSVTAAADSTNNATSDGLNIELTGITVDVPTTETKTDHVTEAFVFDGANIAIAGGGLALDANSRSRAAAGSIDVTIAGVDVAESDATMIAGGATRAFVGEGVTLSAPSLSAAATSDNDAALGHDLRERERGEGRRGRGDGADDARHRGLHRPERRAGSEHRLSAGRSP